MTRQHEPIPQDRSAPAETSNATARALLSAASQPGDELTADEIVVVGTRHSLDHAQNEAALHRWDDEGGHNAPMGPADRGPASPSCARSASSVGGLI